MLKKCCDDFVNHGYERNIKFNIHMFFYTMIELEWIEVTKWKVRIQFHFFLCIVDVPCVMFISQVFMRKLIRWLKLNYRKCVISNRGYYFFQTSWGAALNQERLLFKSGYYYEFCFFLYFKMCLIYHFWQFLAKITWNHDILMILCQSLMKLWSKCIVLTKFPWKKHNYELKT